MFDAFAIVGAGLAVGALFLSVLNAFLWPRGEAAVDGTPLANDTALCIPARNEAENIEAGVLAALRTGAHEVVVADDGSTDATPVILARLAAQHPRLRVVRGDGVLPRGVVGKPHACARLARATTTAHLLMIDADVVVDPSIFARLADIQNRTGARAITAVPRQRTVSFVERLVMPLLHLTYTSWLLLPLVWWTHNRRFLAANGQILLINRAALDGVGGFEAVEREVVDDMALCRRLKEHRQRVVFADGDRMATCRMYTSARDVIDGFSKNLSEGVGGAVGVFVVVMLYFSAFVLPWLLLPMSVWAAVAVAAALSLRLLHVARHGHPVWSALLHPVGVLLFLWIAVRSAVWAHRGQIAWRGRVYASRADRVSREA
jgi:chlorobactene glucosyltransferase